jgi:hypothetical protein
VLDAWMDYTRNPQNVLFTCNGRIFHHSLCSVELSEFLKTSVDALEIHAHLLAANLIKVLSKLPEQAEKQHSELFDPLIHPYAATAAPFHFNYAEADFDRCSQLSLWTSSA